MYNIQYLKPYIAQNVYDQYFKPYIVKKDRCVVIIGFQIKTRAPKQEHFLFICLSKSVKVAPAWLSEGSTITTITITRVFLGGSEKGNPAMTTIPVRRRRKGDPQLYVV